MRPSRQMWPGMMPAFPCPAVMMPGQFGPIRRVRFPSMNVSAFSMSVVGMPSVMQTARGIPASAASMIASAANGGGTKITVASAPVSRIASCTLLKIGQPSCVVPPLPGVTPPTTCVPYAAAALAWNVPSRPVRPCTISRVCLSRRTATSALPRQRDDFLRRLTHRISRCEAQPALPQHALAFFDVGSFHPHHDRHAYAELGHGGDDPLRQHVAAQDAAEDVDQYGLDVLVGHEEAERVLDLLRVGAAADIEEVGWLAPCQLDDVHRRHRQTGAVHHAADVAVQTDVVERELRRLDLERIFFADVAQLTQIRVPVEGVVVEAHLGVEREQIATPGQDERVDLEHRRVGVDEGLVDGIEERRQLIRRWPAQTHAKCELTALERDDAGSGVDVLAENLLRFPGRDLFDVYAAGSAGDDDGRCRRAIDEDAEIELAVDVEPFLDEYAADLLAFGAGLMRDQRHADHLLRELFDLVDRFGNLHAAALAAATSVNLCLYDGTATTEPLRRIDRFGRGERNFAARDGNAEAREH